jgi:5-methylcytosine-specific restriction endonuclease McrA
MKKKLPAFRAWLQACGASVMEPTNEWELFRFKGDNGIAVCYSSKRGSVTFVGDAQIAWDAFTYQRPYRANPATTRRRKPASPIIRTLRKRDGDLCFFCQRFVSAENETQEHLVAVTHGGPNHISNLVLAHKHCNAKAGHLDAVSKIAQHVAARLELERARPELPADEPACLHRRRPRTHGGLTTCDMD